MTLLDMYLVMDEKENIYVFDNVEQKQHEFIIGDIPADYMNKEVVKVGVTNQESIYIEVE